MLTVDFEWVVLTTFEPRADFPETTASAFTAELFRWVAAPWVTVCVTVLVACFEDAAVTVLGPKVIEVPEGAQILKVLTELPRKANSRGNSVASIVVE